MHYLQIVTNINQSWSLEKGDSLYAGSVTCNIFQVVQGASAIVKDLGSSSFENYELRGEEDVLVDGTGSRLIALDEIGVSAQSTISVESGGYCETRNLYLGNEDVDKTCIVDARSTLEVGSKGTALPGAITVDKGASIVAYGFVGLSAPQIVVDGSINLEYEVPADPDNESVTSLSGLVTGSGQIRVDSNTTLVIGRTSSLPTIYFAGGNSTLDVNAPLSLFGASLRGLAPTDTIVLSDTTFTRADWARGVLSVLDGSTVVGKIRVFGDYNDDAFRVSGSTITLSANSDAERPPILPTHLSM